MSWIHSSAPAPTASQRFALFACDTLPLMLAIILAILLDCALELRLGITAADFMLIAEM